MKAGQDNVDRGCPPRAGILLAAGVACAALVIHGVPDVAETLQWQRGGGAWWGITWVTAHLCHWSWNHLVWDLLAFGILSLLCLRLCPACYAPCLLTAAFLIPVEIRLNQPLLDSYRGLSGLDSALMGLVVASLWRQPDGRARAPQVLALIGGMGFLAKVLHELSTGGTVFVADAAATFVPAISAHLVGFAAGVAVGLFKSGVGSQSGAAVLHSHCESETVR